MLKILHTELIYLLIEGEFYEILPIKSIININVKIIFNISVCLLYF